MTRHRQQSSTVRFGSFEADLDAGELRREGKPLSIQDQPFQLLALLLEHSGELVTREQIRQRLWPADTYVDFDRSLNMAVSRLREALGDSADHPRFVQTLPRRGYRFIERTEGRGDVAGPAGLPVDRQPGHGSVWTGLALAGAATAGAVALLLMISRLAEPELLNPRRFSTFLGREGTPAFSPDGNHIAYAAVDAGNRDIYVQPFASQNFLRITTDEAADHSPVYSPDGARIAFLREGADGTSAAVMLVPSVGGGAEQRLADLRWRELPHRNLRLTLDYSPDGRTVAVAQGLAANGRTAIHLVDTATGQMRPFSSPPEGLGDSAPRFSPDGRQIAFVRWTSNWISGYVVAQSLADDRARAITSEDGYVLDFAWSHDGKHIIFGSNEGLHRVRATGGSPILVGNICLCTSPATSRTGRRLAWLEMDFDIDLWRMDLGGSNPSASARRLIDSSVKESSGAISPDGTRIVFASNRARFQESELAISDSDGGDSVPIVSLPWADRPRWSPDGNRIAFTATHAGRSDIYVVRSDGAEVRRLTSDASDNSDSEWSRDGKWIFFVSTRKGSQNIWRMSADGSQPLQITKRGGSNPQPDPSGKVVYYTSNGEKGAEVRMVDPERGDEHPLLDSSGQRLTLHCTRCFVVRTGRAYFLEPSTETKDLILVSMDLRTRRRTRIAPLPGTRAEWPVRLDISHDETWLVYNPERRYEGDVMVAEYR